MANSILFRQYFLNERGSLRDLHAGMALGGGGIGDGTGSYLRLKAAENGKSLKLVAGSNGDYARFDCTGKPTCDYSLSLGRKNRDYLWYV